MLRLDSKQFRTLSDELLRSGRRVRFQATGASMYPTIHDGDFITVEPVSLEAIRVGDVVLSSNQERLLVHRVVGLEKGGFSTRGDALALGDAHTGGDLLLGRVVEVEPMRIGFVVARAAVRALGPASLPAIRGVLWGERALLRLAGRSGRGRCAV